MKRSYLTCPHRNIQQFTECCLDCGWNIYTTADEYLQALRKKAGKPAEINEIMRLEKELGITQ